MGFGSSSSRAAPDNALSLCAVRARSIALLGTVAACSLTALGETALAQGAAVRESHAAAPIAMAVRAEIEVSGADGRVTLAPATSAAPGDSVLYTVTFTNTADEPLDRVRITQAFPSGVVYVEGTAVAPGAAVLFSVDDGLTFGLPAELTIVNADGTRRAAAAGDYTHVRWLLAAPLDAAATGYARFRARMR